MSTSQVDKYTQIQERLPKFKLITNLQHSTKSVLLLLENLDNERGCFAKRNTLAKMASLSIHTINRAIATLKKDKLVTVEKRGVARNQPGNIQLTDDGRGVAARIRDERAPIEVKKSLVEPVAAKQKPKRIPSKAKHSLYHEYNRNKYGVSLKALKAFVPTSVVISFKCEEPHRILAAWEYSKNKQNPKSYMIAVLKRNQIPPNYFADARFKLNEAQTQNPIIETPEPIPVVTYKPRPKREETKDQKRKRMERQFLSDPRTAWKAQML